MKKRAMAGLLAMTMAATMFAGCGSTAADSQTADAQGSAEHFAEASRQAVVDMIADINSVL